MRFLFLSNFFPPDSHGGYERYCSEMAMDFARRGHQVDVLTSRAGEEAVSESVGSVTVHRALHLEIVGGMLSTARRQILERNSIERENEECVKSAVQRLAPDHSLIWGMWNVPGVVPISVEKLMDSRVSYYMCDYWATYPSAFVQQWQAPARNRLLRWPKLLLGQGFAARHENKSAAKRLRLEHVICVSRALKEGLLRRGVPVENAKVIHVGAAVKQFAEWGRRRSPLQDRLRLVLVGRLSPEKGVHIALEAMAHLARAGTRVPVLDIYGVGNPGYEADLRELTHSNSLDDLVTFRGRVPHSDLPEVLARYDVLLLPSVWSEPFALIVLEAMASGLAVIGTETGGTGEVLEHQVTGLTVSPGDARALASAIKSLERNQDLIEVMGRAGQRRVLQEFTFERQADRLEQALLNWMKSAEVRG